MVPPLPARLAVLGSVLGTAGTQVILSKAPLAAGDPD